MFIPNQTESNRIPLRLFEVGPFVLPLIFVHRLGIQKPKKIIVHGLEQVTSQLTRQIQFVAGAQHKSIEVCKSKIKVNISNVIKKVTKTTLLLS